jgi:exosortase A
MNQVAHPRPVPEAISASLAQPWPQALAALALLLGWTLFLYRETGLAMIAIWARSDTFAHAFLVPPIVLWLVWRQRAAILASAAAPAAGVLPAMAGVGLVWLLGELAAVNAVTQLALVALLVLTVPAVLGWVVTRLIVFPLGFLFFAVPIGEFLMPQLMAWTANFTVIALRLSGIPVYREGLQFVIPSGNWSVVEACSGVRYLIASITVGALFAYLNYRSSKRRILFMLVSILTPIIANWMRAYIIVMLGHLSGNKLAAGVDHLIYGWLFFGVVIMGMFVIGARWAEPETMASASGSDVRAPTRTVAQSWPSAACLAALLAWPHVAQWAIDRGDGAGAVVLAAPAVLAPDWRAAPSAVAAFKPAFQNPSAEINTSYASEGRAVGLYLAYYRNQNYSRKLVSSSNVLVTGKDRQWVQVANGSRTITFNGKPVAVRTAELRGAALAGQSDPTRLVVWQFYWINETITASDHLAKVHGALQRLMGRGDDGAAIIVYTHKGVSESAEAVLESFLSANHEPINALLRKARQDR